MNTKPIPFNPKYSVSDDGRVFSQTGREMSYCRWNQEYKIVKLVRPGKKQDEPGYVTNRSVHRLVAEAFLEPKPFDKALVRHKNDNPTDNRVENLCWGTYSDNLNDRIRNGKNQSQIGSCNGNSKLSEDDVIDIRILRKFGAKQKDIGVLYDVPQAYVSAICMGKTWSHIKEGI